MSISNLNFTFKVGDRRGKKPSDIWTKDVLPLFGIILSICTRKEGKLYPESEKSVNDYVFLSFTSCFPSPHPIFRTVQPSRRHFFRFRRQIWSLHARSPAETCILVIRASSIRPSAPRKKNPNVRTKEGNLKPSFVYFFTFFFFHGGPFLSETVQQYLTYPLLKCLPPVRNPSELRRAVWIWLALFTFVRSCGAERNGFVGLGLPFFRR